MSGVVLNDHRSICDLGDDRDVECITEGVDLRKKLAVVGSNIFGMKSVESIAEDVCSADIACAASELIGHFVKFVGNYVLHEVFDCDRHYDFLLLVNSFNI